MGETVNGKPAGLVRAIHIYGILYEGMMNEQGERHGWGVWYYLGEYL